MKSPALLLASILLLGSPWLATPAAAHDRGKHYDPPRHGQRVHPHERRYHPPPPPPPRAYRSNKHTVIQHNHYYAPPRAYAPPPPPRPAYYGYGYSHSPAIVIGVDIPPLVIPLR
jgi:hypothetical protein